MKGTSQLGNSCNFKGSIWESEHWNQGTQNRVQCLLFFFASNCWYWEERHFPDCSAFLEHSIISAAFVYNLCTCTYTTCTPMYSYRDRLSDLFQSSVLSSQQCRVALSRDYLSVKAYVHYVFMIFDCLCLFHLQRYRTSEAQYFRTSLQPDRPLQAAFSPLNKMTMRQVLWSSWSTSRPSSSSWD